MEVTLQSYLFFFPKLKFLLFLAMKTTDKEHLITGHNNHFPLTTLCNTDLNSLGTTASKKAYF